MTLACKDVNSKLVDVVTVADVDAGKHVDDNWCNLGHIANFFDFEVEVQAIF